jgi:hypothetical protein
MSISSRVSIHGSAALFALAILIAASAQGAPGQWTRSQGGVVVDVLDLTPKGDGYLIELREGFGKPVYTSGFCTAAGGKTICGVRNANGKTGLIELTPLGTGLHYRSYYDEGSTKWEGEFAAAQGATVAGKAAPAAPSAAAVPTPPASQWTRSEAGAVVDVLDLTPQGNGYQFSLREGIGKPIYASGSCKIQGDTVTCDSRNANGKTGQIVLTIRGDNLHYRSSYDAGKAIWEGNFVRSQLAR